MVMTDITQHGVELNAGALKRGAWVFSIGSLLALIGLAIASKEFAAAAKRYVDQMPVPPSELARQGWSQARGGFNVARSAAAAGAAAGAAASADAWRKSAANS
jgi:hypothetical protein